MNDSKDHKAAAEPPLDCNAGRENDAEERIWLQRPCRAEDSEWYGEVTWCQDKVNDDDTEYVRADLVERLREIEAAARNLVAQKGRHHTEQAYARLAALMVPNVPGKGLAATRPTKETK